MARSSIDVTFDEPDFSRLPDLLTPGLAVLLELGRRGLLHEAASRLQIRRQGGYSGFDVWVMLVLFMATGAVSGIRKFWDLVRPHMLRVAALAGRRKLMAPASLSRALGAVEIDLVRPQSTWLLTGLTEIDTVLRHPALKAYDAHGQGWHVFHLDPTVTTLRHRALPADEDLPEPRRRSEETAAPGYSGRKRGNVQFRRITVQHAGSGAWLHAHLSKGNGNGVTDLELALDSIVATCERLEHPQNRSLTVLDGEYGNVPWFSACRQRGLPFITRLNRPSLNEDPAVLEQLRKACWQPVPDSLSGPSRSAADIGVITVHPDRRTRAPDGSKYAPVELRVVASIFPNEGKAKRGRALDGYQVELFAVDADAGAWPAADAVAAYFGRNGEENRFAQEDRELGLDRIVSYHLPGQELAVLVGLSLWNLQIARGFALEPPPEVAPAQRLRTTEPDTCVPEHWPRDPVVARLLRELDWEALLEKRAGWSFDPDSAELGCEDGRPLSLTTVRPEAHAEGRTSIIFRRPKGGCEDCDARAGCLHSGQVLASKHVELSVPSKVAESLRARLAAIRGRDSAPASQEIEPITTDPGPLMATSSMFLPARARQRFAEVFTVATLHVEVELPEPEPPRPRLVAKDEADRQRRRSTWQQNVDRYALPDDAKVRLHVAGSADLRRMLGERQDPAIAKGGASS